MEGLDGHLFDAALDIQAVADDLAELKRDNPDKAIQIENAIVRLREACDHVQVLITAPHSLPPHQSE